MDQKKCPKCLEIKKSSEFYKFKDKLHSYCKPCDKKYIKELFDKIEKIELKEKKCSNCKEIKDISNFAKKHYSKDDKCYVCKECDKIRFEKVYKKPTKCECGRIIQYLTYLDKHLKTNYHNKRV